MAISIFPARFTPYFLGLLRIVIGLLFIQHGTAKLFHVPHVEMFDKLQLVSLLGAAGVLELVGGALMIIGLFTRPTAFVLSGMMAVAFFLYHFKDGPIPLLNKGELAVVYCFVFLFFAAAGPGRFAVDRN
jgi:putative oxidoreductase